MALNAKADKEDDTQQTQQMDIINVNDNIWLDTLAWIGREEVSMKFALVNTRFDALVDKQLQQRMWCFGDLHICERKEKGTGAEIMKSDGDDFITLPLGKTPLLSSVIGFLRLSIWYIDKEVITFLHNIRRLFKSNIALEFTTQMTEYRSWKVMARHIWPLFKNGINMLMDLKRRDLAMLRKHVSPTVLFDCAKLRKISTLIMPECPTANDSENTAGRDLYLWIHSPRSVDDGLPIAVKLLKWKKGWKSFVNNVSKTFMDAAFPINFIIFSAFPFDSPPEESKLENHLTDERLTFSSYEDLQANTVQTNAMLLRAPMDFNGVKMMCWTQIANEDPENLVIIGFNDYDIGELPPRKRRGVNKG